MKVSIAVFSFGALFVVGCTPVTDIYGANGQNQKLIECHGLALSMADCYRKAA